VVPDEELLLEALLLEELLLEELLLDELAAVDVLAAVEELLLEELAAVDELLLEELAAVEELVLEELATPRPPLVEVAVVEAELEVAELGAPPVPEDAEAWELVPPAGPVVVEPPPAPPASCTVSPCAHAPTAAAKASADRSMLPLVTG
jgi:hypothetical protein